MGMNNEPPRCQECQELSFSIKRENKIIPLSLQRLFAKLLKVTPMIFRLMLLLSNFISVFCIIYGGIKYHF